MERMGAALRSFHVFDSAAACYRAGAFSCSPPSRCDQDTAHDDDAPDDLPHACPHAAYSE